MGLAVPLALNMETLSIAAVLALSHVLLIMAPISVTFLQKCVNCRFSTMMIDKHHENIPINFWPYISYSDYRGILYFSYFCLKHRLWVLVRTATSTIYVSKQKYEPYQSFLSKKISVFGGEISSVCLNRRVFVMFPFFSVLRIPSAFLGQQSSPRLCFAVALRSYYLSTIYSCSRRHLFFCIFSEKIRLGIYCESSA